MISFKPKTVTKKLLAALPERARDVLEKRYGLSQSGETFTLEAIGKSYGITRERVRQIENYGIQSIQKSEVYKEYYDLFLELQRLIDELGGGLIAEHVLLDELTNDPLTKNHLYFLLVVGDPFYKSKENPRYAHRWYTERKIADHVEQALRDCVDAAGATLLHIHLHPFEPNGGVSGVAVLAESHISIHSWPERNYAALDVFMCGAAEPEKCVPVLERAFAPQKTAVSELKRGAVAA